MCTIEMFGAHLIRHFFSAPHSSLLTMKIDWFQPFVRRPSYSDGAIYVTIQNLPRHLRYRLILIALVPGPNEPELILNTSGRSIGGSSETY